MLATLANAVATFVPGLRNDAQPRDVGCETTPKSGQIKGVSREAGGARLLRQGSPMRNHTAHLTVAFVLASFAAACAAETAVAEVDPMNPPPVAQPDPGSSLGSASGSASDSDSETQDGGPKEDVVVVPPPPPPPPDPVWAPQVTEVASCEVPAHDLARDDLRSYPRDAQGWTILPVPASEAEGRIIHVSSAYSQNKTRPAGAKAHEYFVGPAEIADKAITNWLRPGQPDQIWFARGETFTLNLDLNSARGGAGQAHPMVFRAEPGTGARPILRGTIGAFLGPGATARVANMIVADLDIAPPPSGASHGIHLSKSAPGSGAVPVQVENLLFEGVRVRDFGKTNVSIEARREPATNVAFPIRNIMFRRSQIIDARPSAAHYSQGMYVEGVSGLLIEESVFDANGVQSVDPSTLVVTRGGADTNQNVYINARNNCVVFRGNVSARAQSYALQLRAGGVAEDNFFGYSPNLMSFGQVRGDAVKKGLLPAGVTGAVRRNVLWVGSTQGASQGPGGMQVANIARANIEQNLIARTETPTTLSFGLSFGAFVGIGIHQLTVTNNCISKVHHPFEGFGKLYGPGVVNADGSVTVRDGTRTADCPGDTDGCTGITPPGAPIAIADPGKSVTATGNQYSNVTSGTTVVLSPNESISAASAPLKDGYSLVDYVVGAGLPAPANDEAAMRVIAAKGREMTRGNWDPRFLGAAISAGLRKGFGGSCQ